MATLRYTMMLDGYMDGNWHFTYARTVITKGIYRECRDAADKTQMIGDWALWVQKLVDEAVAGDTQVEEFIGGAVFQLYETLMQQYT